MLPLPPLAIVVLPISAGSPWLQMVSPEASISPAVKTGWTVISTTSVSAAPVQSVLQSTLANRLYQEVWVKAPGLKIVELLDVILSKPVASLVVEICHLYSNVPPKLLAPLELVKALGVVP